MKKTAVVFLVALAIFLTSTRASHAYPAKFGFRGGCASLSVNEFRLGCVFTQQGIETQNRAYRNMMAAIALRWLRGHPKEKANLEVLVEVISRITLLPKMDVRFAAWCALGESLFYTPKAPALKPSIKDSIF